VARTRHKVVVQAYLRHAVREHVLSGPLGAQLSSLSGHLDGRARATLDVVARIDRERTRGGHAFERVEIVHLLVTAHGLFADPPAALRQARRLADGPHPAARAFGDTVAWLRECLDAHPIVYDLYPLEKRP
jgi:hypothetical protein